MIAQRRRWSATTSHNVCGSSSYASFFPAPFLSHFHMCSYFVGVAPCCAICPQRLCLSRKASRSRSAKQHGNTLDIRDASTHAWAWYTSNIGEHSSLCSHVRTRLPLYNWRKTAGILDGTPEQVRTVRRRVWSKESKALVKSMGNMYRGTTLYTASEYVVTDRAHRSEAALFLWPKMFRVGSSREAALDPAMGLRR